MQRYLQAPDDDQINTNFPLTPTFVFGYIDDENRKSFLLVMCSCDRS